MKAKYYVAYFPDNGSDWLPLDNGPYVCQECGSKLTRLVSNSNFYLKKKSYDVSITYDGYIIVSNKLKKLMDSMLIKGDISKCPGDRRYMDSYYVIRDLLQVVNIDVKASEVMVGERCQTCGEAKYVVGAKQYVIDPYREITDGFYRSDLEFGDGIEKCFALIVGVNSAKAMADENIAGLEMMPIY